MGKYDGYLFEIPQQFHSWYGTAKPRGFYKGNLMIPNSKFYWDFTGILKEQPMEIPHTHHAVDEYFLFTGTDFANFWNFDAEVDIWIGEDPEKQEKYTVTTPTIVRIPPKLYHCPIHFRPKGTPILFSAIYLDGDWSKINRRVNENGDEEYWYDGQGIRRCVYDRSQECVYCGKCFSITKGMTADNEPGAGEKEEEDEKPSMEWVERFLKDMGDAPRSGKYDVLVHSFRPEKHDDPRFVSPRAAFYGADEMEGARLRFMLGAVQQEGEIGQEPHMHHGIEENYIFCGSDILKFFEFDATVEIQLGDDPNHMETYTITKPSVVRIPSGLWHGPVTVKNLNGTIGFIPMYPSGDYGKVTFENGLYRYDGTDLPK